jgi:hypothetical protein
LDVTHLPISFDAMARLAPLATSGFPPNTSGATRAASQMSCSLRTITRDRL